MSGVALIPGQTLWYVSSRSRLPGPGYAVTVDRIGKRWVYLAHNHGRMEIGSMVVDGGENASPGACYLSEADYHECREAKEAFDEFRRRVGYHIRPGVKKANVEAAAALLRLDEEES